MFALNYRIDDRSGPHINVMLNCKIGNPEIHMFMINLEIGSLNYIYFRLNWATELYIFMLNLEMGAPEPYIFTLNLESGTPKQYIFTLNLEMWALEF